MITLPIVAILVQAAWAVAAPADAPVNQQFEQLAAEYVD